MLINLSMDCVEDAPEIVKEVLSNKEKDVSFRYVCSECNNSLPVRSKNVSISCRCGGVMKYQDASLQEYRVKKNLTQKAVAQLVGVSKNYITMIEAGVRPIPKSIKKLMERR